MLKDKKKQCEEPKQISEPDSDMTQSFKLSVRSLKQLQSNMLRALVEKVKKHARTDRY